MMVMNKVNCEMWFFVLYGIGISFSLLESEEYDALIYLHCTD